MFTIVDQLVDVLQLSIPSSLRDTLTKCAKQRSMVCRELLRTDIPTGKGLLTAVMAGASLAPPWDRNEFLLGLRKLSRYMRWVACACLPDVFQVCINDAKRTLPESSTFYVMWSAVEDLILSKWMEYTMERPVRHLSLHCNGIRLDADLPEGVDDYCQVVAEHVFAETGFRIHIKEKASSNTRRAHGSESFCVSAGRQSGRDS